MSMLTLQFYSKATMWLPHSVIKSDCVSVNREFTVFLKNLNKLFLQLFKIKWKKLNFYLSQMEKKFLINDSVKNLFYFLIFFFKNDALFAKAKIQRKKEMKERQI